MKKFLNIILLSAAVMMISVTSAFAMDLDAAKSSGLVREKSNGLIETTLPNPSPELKELVNTTNAGRLEVYKKIASDSNVPLREVQAMMAKKLMEQENSGR